MSKSHVKSKKGEEMPRLDELLSKLKLDLGQAMDAHFKEVQNTLRKDMGRLERYFTGVQMVAVLLTGGWTFYQYWNHGHTLAILDERSKRNSIATDSLNTRLALIQIQERDQPRTDVEFRARAVQTGTAVGRATYDVIIEGSYRNIALSPLTIESITVTKRLGSINTRFVNDSGASYQDADHETATSLVHYTSLGVDTLTLAGSHDTLQPQELRPVRHAVHVIAQPDDLVDFEVCIRLRQPDGGIRKIAWPINKIKLRDLVKARG